jgi:hypothetical protein
MNTLDLEENTYDEIAKLASRDSREDVRELAAELRSAVDEDRDGAAIVEAMREVISH